MEHQEERKTRVNGMSENNQKEMQNKKRNGTDDSIDIPDLIEFKWQLDAMREKVRKYHNPSKGMKEASLAEQLKLQGNQLLKESLLIEALNAYNEVRIDYNNCNFTRIVMSMN